MRISFAPREITYKDFDRLEGKATHFWKHLSLVDIEDLQFYKNLYLKNWPKENTSSEQHIKIPKTIHYIWLGPNEFPKNSVAFVQSWIQKHPDWTVKFWTDQKERLLPCAGMERHLITELALPHIGSYVEKTSNYGEKSDLLRYEILFQEGGIYVDHDIECFHSFASLTSSVDFFAGLEPPHRNKGIDSRVFCCNALIGAKAGHPILLKALEDVKQRWEEIEQKFSGSDVLSKTLKVFHRTFYSFALAVREKLNQEGNKDIVLPASFFYPDRIASTGEFDSWKAKGLIWTSHKCAGEWRPADPLAEIKEKLELEKAKKRHLKRALKQMRVFLYSSFALSGLCIYLAVRNKRQMRILSGRKSL